MTLKLLHIQAAVFLFPPFPEGSRKAEIYTFFFLLEIPLHKVRASLVAQVVKNSTSMQETLVRFQVRRHPGEGIGYPLQYSWVSLVAQMVKNLPTMQETWVRSLGWDDPPGGEHGYQLQYSCLEKSPWTEEPGRLQSMRSQRVSHD